MTDDISGNDLDFLYELEQIIRSRLKESPEGSYTASLAAEGVQRIAQKVGEEAVEVALAAVGDDRDRLRDESADLVFHLLLLLSAEGIDFTDVVRVLRDRHAN